MQKPFPFSLTGHVIIELVLGSPQITSNNHYTHLVYVKLDV